MADFKTKGFKEFARKINKLKGDIRKRAVRAVTSAVINVEREAKKAVAVDTGRLRSSIRFDIRDDGLTGEVFTDVFYAPFIEFGTVKMRARPFLFPAFQKAQVQLIEDMKAL